MLKSFLEGFLVICEDFAPFLEDFLSDFWFQRDTHVPPAPNPRPEAKRTKLTGCGTKDDINGVSMNPEFVSNGFSISWIMMDYDNYWTIMDNQYI
jgi:hypothetical protein